VDQDTEENQQDPVSSEKTEEKEELVTGQDNQDKTKPETPSEESKEEEKEEAKLKGTILLIEDDLPMVKMYSTKLKIEGFQIVVAYDGEEGLTKLKEEPPGLVLLDLMIPKVGGMEVLEQMKADAKLKDVPVVVLSNLSQEEDMVRAKELGVKDFLIKSNYTPSQVVKIVKSYFEK